MRLDIDVGDSFDGVDFVQIVELIVMGCSPMLTVGVFLSVMKGRNWVCGCGYCGWDCGLRVRSKSFWVVKEPVSVEKLWSKIDGAKLRVLAVA